MTSVSALILPPETSGQAQLPLTNPQQLALGMWKGTWKAIYWSWGWAAFVCLILWTDTLCLLELSLASSS
jgi:hypothetical protein